MVIYTLKPGYFIDFCCKSTCFYQNRTINHQKYGANQTFLLFSLDYSSKCRRFAAFLIHVPTAKQIRFSLIAHLNGKFSTSDSLASTGETEEYAAVTCRPFRFSGLHICISSSLRYERDIYTSRPRCIYVLAEMNIRPCHGKKTSLPR